MVNEAVIFNNLKGLPEVTQDNLATHMVTLEGKNLQKCIKGLWDEK